MISLAKKFDKVIFKQKRKNIEIIGIVLDIKYFTTLQ
jgi:hypothetical protein